MFGAGSHSLVSLDSLGIRKRKKSRCLGLRLALPHSERLDLWRSIELTRFADNCRAALKQFDYHERGSPVRAATRSHRLTTFRARSESVWANQDVAHANELNPRSHALETLAGGPEVDKSKCLDIVPFPGLTSPGNQLSLVALLVRGAEGI